jgi:drug/metabolite transporter (DMT)-like permease
MTPRKYLILLSVVIFAACGDVSLARGMRAFGAVTLANLPNLFTALLNPWVVLGILMLIAFFASYLSALSWADLTFVLPATSLSYILMVLLAMFFLHENVTVWRWLGVALIVAGVGFVASGPEATPGAHRHNRVETVYGPVGALGEVADTGSDA